MIELGKKYQTRDGREVRVYAVDGGGVYPTHGAYLCGEGWIHETWTTEGLASVSCRSRADLIEVKPERTMWINVYRDHGFGSQGQANIYATSDRLACVKVTYREGDGLDATR